MKKGGEMSLVYFLIAIFSTTIGAVAGIGGGVIIKPVLDFIGAYSIETINILSSVTVFFMAIASIIKHIRAKSKIDLSKTIYIGIGSIFGGVIGEKGLKVLLEFFSSNSVTIIQNTLLALISILILILMSFGNNIRKFNIQNRFYASLVGLLLGIISSFLSIGGGPLNVYLFVMLFAMTTKEATVNSVAIIFLSQGAKLLTVFGTTDFRAYDLSVLPFMVVGGVLGGLIGSKINQEMSSRSIDFFFKGVLTLLLTINIIIIFSTSVASFGG